MSEKRFKLSRFAIPSELSDFCDENGRMLNKEVVKVLNEQLSIIRRDEVSMKTMMSNIEKLEKENEQLKIANTRWLDKSLQDKQIRYSNTNSKELTTKYLQFKEENEQLRNELQFFDKIINFFADNPMTKYSSKAELLEEMKLLEKMGLI